MILVLRVNSTKLEIIKRKSLLAPQITPKLFILIRLLMENLFSKLKVIILLHQTDIKNNGLNIAGCFFQLPCTLIERSLVMKGRYDEITLDCLATTCCVL